MAFITMRPQDEVGVTFVNSVVVHGTYNGVVNLSFAVYNFSPAGENEIELDPVIVSRLRMDVTCLRQLYKVCENVLASIEQAVEPHPDQTEPKKVERVSPKRGEKTH